MSTTPAALGIDFGTSHTVAAVRMPGGRVESLLFDASPLLPSAVFAQPDGALLVGHDALRNSRLDPGRSEPNPKRYIGDGTLLLGDVETPVERVVRAVLARVAETAQRALGGVPRPVVLTHPAGWGARRRAVLAEAAAAAGLGPVRLVAEPVAAALYFTEVLGHRVEPGGTLVVYDLGGGTFDISAVRRLADGGWEVRATAGLDDVGGVDIDAAIVGWMAAHAGAEAVGTGAGLAERRRRQSAQQEARAAKEQLSRVATAPILLPGPNGELHLTRAEFDELARPLLERTVVLTTSTLFAGGITADRLAGVFLVGGSSRIPLVGTMLHRALGVAPTVIDQPELVVAHGSLRTPPEDGPAPVAAMPPVSATPMVGAAPMVDAGPPVTAVPMVDANPARTVAAPPPAPSPGTPMSGPPPWPAGPPAQRPPAGADPASGQRVRLEPGGRQWAGVEPAGGQSAGVEPAGAGSASSRRPPVAFAVAVLLGAVVGAAITGFPALIGYDGLIPYWTERYAWQLVPVAGLLAGLWSRRPGAAIVAQGAAGVVAGLVGLAAERAGRNIFDLLWGTPIEFYYWEHHPDVWFLTLVGGCLAAGLALEGAFAATRWLGSAGLTVALVTAAGMLPNLLLLWIFDFESRPRTSRVAIDVLFAYPFVVLLAWPAAWLSRRRWSR